MGFGLENLGEDAAGSSLHQSELQEARRNYKWRAISGTSRYIKMTKVPMYFGIILGLVTRLGSPSTRTGPASEPAAKRRASELE